MSAFEHVSFLSLITPFSLDLGLNNGGMITTHMQSARPAGEKGPRIPSNYTTKQFLPSPSLGISSAGFAEKQVVSAQSKVEEGIQQYIENASFSFYQER